MKLVPLGRWRKIDAMYPLELTGNVCTSSMGDNPPIGLREDNVADYRKGEELMLNL
jgi:hypothetical protein